MSEKTDDIHRQYHIVHEDVIINILITKDVS